jgi:hypothetical protein
VEGKWIHSRYAPRKEAARFIRLQGIRPGDLVILYGFGLGHHIVPALEQLGPEGFLYCMETNSRLLRTAFESADFSALFRDPRFRLITGKTPEEMAEALDRHVLWGLESVPREKVRIVIHEPSFSTIPDAFRWIRNSLEMIRFDRRGDSFFQEEMETNLLANLETLVDAPGVKSLERVFGDRPVAVVGAGPSLDRAAPLLKALRKRMWIMCVDTAVIPCRRNGIDPDLAVSIDPQNKSLSHFEGFEDRETPLVIYPTSARAVVRRVRGPRIVAVQKDSRVYRYLEHLADRFGTTLGGNAVSVIAADIALRNTRGPVIFIGMDFAFPLLKAYADFTPEFNAWHQNTAPYYTLETASAENIHSRKTVFIDNFMGARVPTFQSMYRYVRSLETILKFHDRRSVYIVRPEGARIEGVVPLYFDEELETLLPGSFSKRFPRLPRALAPDEAAFLKEKAASSVAAGNSAARIT